MIGTSFAFARSLLSIAGSIVRRVASGDADGVGALALGMLRTQAAGAVFGSMTVLSAPFGNLARAGLLLTAAGAVTLMLSIALANTAPQAPSEIPLVRNAKE